MKKILVMVMAYGVCGWMFTGHAATRYVSVNSGNDTNSGLSWSEAKKTIQSGILAASYGDTVLVTNGTYQLTSSSIIITNAINLQSVNGAGATIVDGNYPTRKWRCVYVRHENAVVDGFTVTRGVVPGNEALGGGVYMTAGVLQNCIITSNSAGEGWETFGDGGGVFMLGGVVRHCIISNNTCEGDGAGVYGGTVEHCHFSGNEARTEGGAVCMTRIRNSTIIDNRAAWGAGIGSSTGENCFVAGNVAQFYGGGAAKCTLRNSTIVRNSALRGGGAFVGALYNTILIHNTCTEMNPNWGDLGTHAAKITLNYCCTTPLPGEGEGNMVNEPGLLGYYNPHLISSSPCIDAGSNADASGAEDIDGEARTNGVRVDIGCDEFFMNGMTGSLAVCIIATYTQVVTGASLSFQAEIQGRANEVRWSFGDGQRTSVCTRVSHAWDIPGTYPVTLEAANATTVSIATTVVHVASIFTNYVAANSANPMAPYSSWATAATNIQTVIDAFEYAGQVVLVSNGVYDSGRVLLGELTNRIAIVAPMVVRSVNGPEQTVIVGQGPAGTNAIRCAYVTNGAVLSGFTLTNGFTGSSTTRMSSSGGGAYCEPDAVVSNCIISGNGSSKFGGGVYGGSIMNCILCGNSSGSGGGAYNAVVRDCTISNNSATTGGGTMGGDIRHCEIIGNSASSDGGGVCDGTIEDCEIRGNSADNSGGGSYLSMINKCVIVANYARGNGGGAANRTIQNSLVYCNTAAMGGGVAAAIVKSCTITDNSGFNGGGVYYGSLQNSIVWSNEASAGQNYYPLNYTASNTCALPIPSRGTGNTEAEPRFANAAAGDFHLLSNSPCIDSGADLNTQVDLEGISRPLDGNNDTIPAYDMGAYEFASSVADTDHDGLSDSEEVHVLGTDAVVQDTDGDGTGDGSEVIITGTNPLDATDYFEAGETHRDQNTGMFVFSWKSRTGCVYTVQSAEAVSGPWVDVPGYTDVAGTGPMMSYTNQTPSASMFYGVSVRLAD